MVSVIIENLADGIDEKEILKSYPSLKPEDVQAALLYAADLSKLNYSDIPASDAV